MDPISSTEIENRIGIFFKSFTQSFPASTSWSTVKSLGGLAPECISSLSVRLPRRTEDTSSRLYRVIELLVRGASVAFSIAIRNLNHVSKRILLAVRDLKLRSKSRLVDAHRQARPRILENYEASNQH
jgi:hypothetical protein